MDIYHFSKRTSKSESQMYSRVCLEDFKFCQITTVLLYERLFSLNIALITRHSANCDILPGSTLLVNLSVYGFPDQLSLLNIWKNAMY